MNYVADIEAVLHTSIVDDEQSAIALNIKRSPRHRCARQLDAHAAAERAHVFAVLRPRIGRKLVVSEEQFTQHVQRVDVFAQASGADRSPPDVQADADDHHRSGRLREYAGELLAVDEQIVGPLQCRLHSAGALTGPNGGHRDALRQCVRRGRYIAKQDRDQKIHTRRRFPLALEPATAGRLMACHQNSSIRRTRSRRLQQVDVGAAGFVDNLDVPTGWPSGPISL